MRSQSSDEARAEALFHLGAFFYQSNDRAKAEAYRAQAQALLPES